METQWKRITHEKIKDIENTLIQDIQETQYSNLKFYIGGDSQFHSNHYVYVVALIMTLDGHGARGYYKKNKEFNTHISLKQRLFKETYYAVDAAVEINPILESQEYEIAEVHTDLNPSKDFPSHEMVKTCIGYIQGFGFVGKVKPESWASIEVADRLSK